MCGRCVLRVRSVHADRARTPERQLLKKSAHSGNSRYSIGGGGVFFFFLSTTPIYTKTSAFFIIFFYFQLFAFRSYGSNFNRRRLRLRSPTNRSYPFFHVSSATIKVREIFLKFFYSPLVVSTLVSVLLLNRLTVLATP